MNAPFWNQRRVLVTGASGFIGGWLASALIEAGADVVGIVRDAPRRSTLNLLGLAANMHIVRGSLTDYALVERAINEYEIDTVFHLAAQAIVGPANRSPRSTFESNIQGTWNLLEACRGNPLVQRIVVASSDKAYGDQPHLPYTEESPLNGLYPYDASKVCADVLARSYAATYGLPVAVTRCANVYGGADLNWSRLIPGTVRSILLGERPIIRSDGTPERDYIFITDAVRAYLTLGERAADPDVRGQAFNFGSGHPVSALTVVQELLQIAGRTDLPPDIRGQGSPHGEIDRQYLDSSRALRVLGWRPQVDLRSGLEIAFHWYRQHAPTLGIPQASSRDAHLAQEEMACRP